MIFPLLEFNHSLPNKFHPICWIPTCKSRLWEGIIGKGDCIKSPLFYLCIYLFSIATYLQHSSQFLVIYHFVMFLKCFYFSLDHNLEVHKLVSHLFSWLLCTWNLAQFLAHSRCSAVKYQDRQPVMCSGSLFWPTGSEGMPLTQQHHRSRKWDISDPDQKNKFK